MPRAELRGIAVNTLMHVGGLASTEVDLAIGPPMAFGGDELRWQRLFEEGGRSFVVAADNDDAQLRRRIPLRALAGRPFVDIEVALGRTGVGGSAARALLAAVGAPPSRRVVVPSFTAAAFCVASSDAFTGLPGRMTDSLVDEIGLRRLEVDVPLPPFTIGVAWHEPTEGDPAVRAFRDLVIQTLGEPPTPKLTRAPRKGRAGSPSTKGRRRRSK